MDWDSLFFSTAALIAGVFVLDYGADKFIDHTVIVGQRLGISPTLIALLTAGAEYEEVYYFELHPLAGANKVSLARCCYRCNPARPHSFSPGQCYGICNFQHPRCLFAGACLLFGR